MIGPCVNQNRDDPFNAKQITGVVSEELIKELQIDIVNQSRPLYMLFSLSEGWFKLLSRDDIIYQC